MAITPVPVYSGTAPNRNSQSPEDFTTNAIAWTDYQATQLVPGINTTAGEINTAAGEVDSAATAAANAATQAANSADVVVTAVNFKGNWSDLTGSLNVPATVYHSGLYWQLLSNLADVTASEPASGNSDWALAVNASGRVPIATPFTITSPGRYFISGNGTITLPTPVGQPDGASYDFARAVGDAPTISGGSNLVKDFIGLTDGHVMDKQFNRVEYVVNNNLYEV